MPEVAGRVAKRRASRPGEAVKTGDEPVFTRENTLLADHALALRGGGFGAAFDHGPLGGAEDADGAADLPFDLSEEVGVLFDELLGVLAALAEADVAVGEPGAGFLDDLVLEADVDQLAGLGDALAVAYVEFRLAEGRGALVLDHLHLDAGADHFLPFLDLVGAADVEAHGGVKLQGPAAGGGLGVAEHHTNFFTNLVDENQTRFRLGNDAC